LDPLLAEKENKRTNPNAFDIYRYFTCRACEETIVLILLKLITHFMEVFQDHHKLQYQIYNKQSNKLR